MSRITVRLVPQVDARLQSIARRIPFSSLETLSEAALRCWLILTQGDIDVLKLFERDRFSPKEIEEFFNPVREAVQAALNRIELRDAFQRIEAKKPEKPKEDKQIEPQKAEEPDLITAILNSP
jgi:predicted DNA-binding protein YlxM (UPF0122 family)